MGSRRMHIGSALWRIARPTIACSSLELNIHLAASSVSPRHCTCTVSNVGVVGRAIFSIAEVEVEVDAEDLVRVRECECVCGGIELDRSRGVGPWPGGVVARVVPLPVGAVVGRRPSCSAPLRLIVGLRGPMGKVRSRRENVETEDVELMGPLRLRDGTDLDILVPSANDLISAGVLGRPEAGSGATMVGGGAGAAAGWGGVAAASSSFSKWG